MLTQHLALKKKMITLSKLQQRLIMMNGVVMLLAMLLMACNGKTPATPIQFGDICKNDKKTIEVVGFARLPPRIECSSSNCSMHFWGNAEAQGQWHWAQLKVGSGKNQMELPPTQFKNTDLKFRDDAGNVLGHNAKVKLTGYVTGPLTPNSNVTFCSISVEKVEQVK